LEHLDKEENQSMSNSIYQIMAAVSMLGVAVILVVALRAYMAAASERRMKSMLERVGVDPVIVASGNATQIISDVRRRCHSCASESLCERWLAGEEQGGNDFCPNANVFATLRKTLTQQ
jgi:PP-loop superfamily ATP-utilizing enzyme